MSEEYNETIYWDMIDRQKEILNKNSFDSEKVMSGSFPMH